MHHLSMDKKHYVHLLIMAVLSFIAMYALMYAMVNSFSNVYPNLNQAYMAGLMTAPMVLIELVVMHAMYKDMKLNIGVGVVSVIVGVGCFFLIQHQAGISNAQFLRSMIPHHAGAILMCEEAPITDPEIKKLCQGIMVGQQSEIDQMKRRLNELESQP